MSLNMKGQIRAIQSALGTRPDGDPKRHTYNSFYLFLCGDQAVTPYRIRAFWHDLIISRPEDTRPFNPKGKIAKRMHNFVSGSFSWNGEPISIMIADGEVIRWHSCHNWCGLPESVLCYYKNGTFAVHRVRYAKDIPNFENILWAIGGAGMGENYNPKAEGFIDGLEFGGKIYNFGDVWRDTNHIMIGYDRFGFVNTVFVTSEGVHEMEKLANNLGLIEYILLDGGHVPACNVDGLVKNLYTRQFYGIDLG